MGRGLKISINIFITLALGYLIFMPFHLGNRAGKKLCGEIVVEITDSSDYRFVTEQRILNMVNKRSDSVLGYPVKSISTDEIEKEIIKIHEIKTVNAWFDIDGVLKITIDQRNPIMRVIPDSGGDYLVDEDGVLFKRSTGVPPRLHIVGGNIRITNDMLKGMSVLDTSLAWSSLQDIYELVEFINDDEFWSAQIDQIYVNKENEIELVPRTGSHVIKLGDIDDYTTKFDKLMLFYEQVMPETGWNKYSEISLEYTNQVVCKRRL